MAAIPIVDLDGGAIDRDLQLKQRVVGVGERHQVVKAVADRDAIADHRDPDAARQDLSKDCDDIRMEKRLASAQDHPPNAAGVQVLDKVDYHLRRHVDGAALGGSRKAIRAG